jgi:hypothetical protein
MLQECNAILSVHVNTASLPHVKESAVVYHARVLHSPGYSNVRNYYNLVIGLRGAKLAYLKSPPRLRHSIPLKSSRFCRRSFLDHTYRKPVNFSL